MHILSKKPGSNKTNKSDILAKIISILILNVFLYKPAFIYGFAGGDGSPGSPYQVATWTHLDNVRSNLDKNFVLTANLDSSTAGYDTLASSTANSGAGWAPIGDIDTPFTGTFNGFYSGQFYTISDLNINRSASAAIGLFGGINSSTMTNISLIDVNISGGSVVGGLTGSNTLGKIDKCYVTGAVTSTSQRTGGFVGQTSGVITSSYFEGTISAANDFIGGFAGINFGQIDMCYSSGTVTVSGTRYDIGGFVGQDLGIISNSYTNTTVSGYIRVGAFAGSADGSEIINCYALGSVTGARYVAGIVGYNYAGDIKGCYAAAYIDCTHADSGGIKGSSAGTGVVSYTFWDTQVSGKTTSVGGVGRTTAQMKDIRTYTVAAFESNGITSGNEWDMVSKDTYDGNVWYIEDGVDYPRFGWQMEPQLAVETEYTGQVSANSALLRGNITKMGEGPIDAYFQFRERGSGTWVDTSAQSVSEEGIYDQSVSLSVDTKYEYRAVVDDGENVAEGTIKYFTTYSSKTWVTEADWQAAQSASKITVTGGEISLSEYALTAVYRYNTAGYSENTTAAWETYHSSTVNVSAMNSMDIGYSYLLTGKSHVQGNSRAMVQVLVDSVQVHTDSATASKSNTWSGSVDVSGKTSVSVVFQFWSERGSTQAGTSRVDIYWAEYEHFDDAGIEASGYLVTDTRSIITSKPSLADLDYELNGQNITVKIIGSPWAAEPEEKTVVLDGASSYPISWDAEHSYFALRIEMSTEDSEVTPVFNSITLLAEDEQLPAEGRYWVASSAGSWNDASNWSESSGGSGGAGVPDSSNLVIFNGVNGSTGNCEVNAIISVSSITITGGYTGTFDTKGYNVAALNNFEQAGGVVYLSTSQVSLGGSWASTGGVFDAQTSTVTFNSAGEFSILSSGTSFYNLVIAADTGSGTLDDSLFVLNNFVMESGSLVCGSSSVRVSGRFRLVSGSSFTAPSSTLYIGGDTTIAPGTFIRAIEGTVVFFADLLLDASGQNLGNVIVTD